MCVFKLKGRESNKSGIKGFNIIYIDQLIEQLIITDVQLFIQTSIFKNTVNKLGKLYRKRKHDKYIFT